MKLSVVVMAHPKRKHYVEELLPKLGDVEVIWDKKDNRWDTGRRSLMAFDPDATHHMVVQDDSVVPQDLIKGVQRMMEYCSHDVPISLYTGKARPNTDLVTRAVKTAVSKGASWIKMPGPWWGVATVTPTVVIPEMVERCDKHPSPNYDLRMVSWWQSQGVDCLYTVPSLVDHREGPSLVKDRTGTGRHAHTPISPLESALGVEWNTRCVMATVMPDSNKGTVTALDPQGESHQVTAKAFKTVLAPRGWLMDHEGKEVSSLD